MDYNHSYWIDLVVTVVAGVDVEEDRIIVDPLRLGLKWFRLDNLRIRGHRYTVSWSEGKDRAEAPKGFRILRAGEKIYGGDTLEKVEIEG